MHSIQYTWKSCKYNQIIQIRAIGLMSRVFVNGQGDRSSIPGWVIPKTQKMVLDAALRNTQHYKVRIKWSNPGNGVSPSPTHPCCSNWKREPSGYSRLRSTYISSMASFGKIFLLPIYVIYILFLTFSFTFSFLQAIIASWLITKVREVNDYRHFIYLCFLLSLLGDFFPLYW